MKTSLTQAKVTACATKIAKADQKLDLGPNPAPLRVVSTQTDTWTLVRGAWVCSASVLSESTITVNGTVVMHQGGPVKP